ncbi:MAG: hypothetical protein ABSC48_11560 [Terracidiphilus sp.]|jgi:hypothetical protein
MSNESQVEATNTHEDIEFMYVMAVLSLVNVARQIRDGKGDDVAEHIEESLPSYLKTMLEFKENNLKTAAFYAGGKLIKSRHLEVEKRLESAIAGYTQEQGQVLSDKCYKLAKCGGGFFCWEAPISLRPVDPNVVDDQDGWRYIVGSTCGFDVFKPSKGCGNPVGLYQCQPPD